MKLTIQLLFSLAIYTFAGWGVSIFLEIYSGYISKDLVEWIYLRKDIALALYLIIGFIFMFLYFWRKPWLYLREIENTMELLCSKDESVIKLSEALKSIEGKMNEVKVTMMLSDKTIKIAEDKKSDLMAYLAHDLRTPLTSIIGYLSMIQENPDMAKEKHDIYIQRLIEKAEYLEQLVNEFFEITQCNTGIIQMQKEKVNLFYMLTQLADEFIPLFLEKNNTITLDIDENMNVKLDPDKMSRVFGNLLRNAIFYSYSNTEIIIAAYEIQGTVEIDFQNRGETLTNDQISKIFKKFGRLDSARNSHTDGAGLGLSIVEEIVQLHGGKIEVESHNEIIIFKISLPCLK